MSRTAEVVRNTKETRIRIHLDLDGTGASEVSTGIGFYDHMLESFARHGGFDLMDETLTRCAIDLSNRPYLIWKVAFARPKVGEMDTELFKEFHHAFAMNAGACVHLETLYGDNSHHIAESGFKALARALRTAVEIDPKAGGQAVSTKGVL